MSSENTEVVELLRAILIKLDQLDHLQSIASGVENLETVKQPSRRVTKDEERAALAVVAVAKGANSFAAVAAELGVSETTARRNQGIRRALQSATADRTVDRREAEDFEWHR